MYTTANDSNDRDPLAFEVFGTNDAMMVKRLGLLPEQA
jgi:hypothetical protein